MSHLYQFKWNQPPTAAHLSLGPWVKLSCLSEVSQLRRQLVDPCLASPLHSDSVAWARGSNRVWTW